MSCTPRKVKNSATQTESLILDQALSDRSPICTLSPPSSLDSPQASSYHASPTCSNPYEPHRSNNIRLDRSWKIRFPKINQKSNIYLFITLHTKKPQINPIERSVLVRQCTANQMHLRYRLTPRMGVFHENERKNARVKLSAKNVTVKRVETSSGSLKTVNGPSNSPGFGEYSKS